MAIPIVNVPGFLNQSRYLPDRRDLNRFFPGSVRGSLTSRLARLFVDEIVSQTTHGIDLHTGAIHRDNFPQIRGNLDDPETNRMACAFGVPVVINTGFRAVESKGLLIGEGADQEVINGIRLIVSRDRRIDRVNEILTMHLGPNDILVTGSLDFADGLRGREVEEAITSFERRIKRSYPAVSRVFIEAQSWRSHEETAIETD